MTDIYRVFGVCNGKEFMKLPTSVFPSEAFLREYSDGFWPAIATERGIYRCTHDGCIMEHNFVSWEVFNRKKPMMRTKKL